VYLAPFYKPIKLMN